MTAEDIYIKLRDELTAENESSSSPERIFIKNDGQTICTLGMNRSHEIIFVEFKPAQKDLTTVEKEPYVHPHPVEMLHDAGWRQAQLTVWEEAEKLLEIINRSYKKKKKTDETPAKKRGIRKIRKEVGVAAKPPVKMKEAPKPAKPEKKSAPAKGKAAPEKAAPAIKKAVAKAKPKVNPKPKPKAKPAAKSKARPKSVPEKSKPAKKKR